MPKGSRPIDRPIYGTSVFQRVESPLANVSLGVHLQGGREGGLPPKLLLTKLLAAREDAAYSGYASTRNVNMPLKTRSVLHCSKAVSDWSYITCTYMQTWCIRKG